jgi:DNA-binding transcriptional LysR family regulator
VTCATPAYLAANGMPTHPRELDADHTAVTYLFPQTGKSHPMRYAKGAEVYDINPQSAVSISESTAHTNAVLAGLGIGQIFDFGTRLHFAEGRLVEVLADWTQPTLPINLVYPATRHPAAKLRAFADWTVEIFADEDRLNV